MKVLRFFLYFILVVLILSGGLLFYVSSTYGEIVEGIVEEALENNLKSEVTFESISTGRFEDLPYFSLVLNDVLILEPEEFSENPDTLIYVERVSLQFDVWDLYKGNYELKKVEIEEGIGRFLVNEKEEANYMFWKDFEENVEDTSDFSFGLKEVSLENIDYSYNDESIDLVTHTTARHAELTGDFNKQSLKLIFRGSFEKTLVSVIGVKYVHYRDLNINSGIEINHETGAINFLQGEIQVDNQFSLKQKGVVKDKDYEFELEADNIRLMQLNSLVPPRYADYKEGYTGSGEVKFYGSVKSGGRRGIPAIEARLDLKNGSLTHKESQTNLNNVQMNMRFSNGARRRNSSSILEFKELHADFPSGRVEGDVRLEDFNKLNLISDVKGNFDLSELALFLGIEKLNNLRGLCQFDMKGNLILSNLTATPTVAKGSNVTGDLKFQNFGFEHRDIPLKVDGLSGEASFPGRDIALKEVRGKIQSSNIVLNGRISNLMHWLFNTASKHDRPVKVFADLELDRLKVDEFIWHEKTEKDGNPIPVAEFILKADIHQFEIRKFTARDVKTNWYLSSNTFIMDPLTMNALGGELSGKLKLSPQGNGKSSLQLHGSAESINVDELFYSFNEFGQNEITSVNLKGRATADIDLKGLVNKEGKLDDKSLVAQANIKVVKGEMINYATLKAISDYFNKNIIYKGLFRAKALEKNLMHINFDTLENQILIKDQKLVIPRMQIDNSVMGVYADGTYSFDNYMDFHFDFDISEILLREKKNFGEKEDSEMSKKGGIRVFLHIYGKPDNLTIEQDKERKKAYKQKHQSHQTSELKTALNEEFGWFKGDTTLIEEKEKELQFELEWEEDSVKASEMKKDSLKKTKKKLPKKPIETEEEFDFGDDDF